MDLFIRVTPVQPLKRSRWGGLGCLRASIDFFLQISLRSDDSFCFVLSSYGPKILLKYSYMVILFMNASQRNLFTYIYLSKLVHLYLIHVFDQF